MCEPALPQVEEDLAEGLPATPGLSWAEEDLHPTPAPCAPIARVRQKMLGFHDSCHP